MDSQKFRFFARKGNNRMISCQIREISVKMSYGGGRGNLRNPCLTMHQPWASLLIYGIKRIEGRSWPAPLTGRLWIHAAGKVPDPETIKAMENFYREIYALNGITDLKFPEHYPVSRLLGCVEVVGCLKCEELVCWDEVPEGVRLEGQTDFCWLCEQPQRLLVPFEMRGYQGVYNLEKKIYEAAVRGLCPVEGPLPVKFPLPDPSDPFSLRPGSLASHFTGSKSSENKGSQSLNAVIAGARAAATQFSKKGQSNSGTRHETNLVRGRDVPSLPSSSQSKNYSAEEVDNRGQFGLSDGRFQRENRSKCVERNSFMGDQGLNQGPCGNFNQKPGAPPKVNAKWRPKSSSCETEEGKSSSYERNEPNNRGIKRRETAGDGAGD